jgi:hypothetical protein
VTLLTFVNGNHPRCHLRIGFNIDFFINKFSRNEYENRKRQDEAITR